MGLICHIGIATFLTLGALVPYWAFHNGFPKRQLCRPKLVTPEAERVLVLGASSGIGRVISHRYAERGARVCVVARRSAELEVVRFECESMAHVPDSVFSICADFTLAEDLVSIRERISESKFAALLLMLKSLTPCQSGMVSIR
jgi:hypothetical protein